MGTWWRLSTAAPPVVHRKGGTGGGDNWALGCTRQGDKECKWIRYKLLVLLSRRGRKIRQARARNMAAARWWPAEAREAVACARQDSRGGLERRATSKRRVGRAAAGGGAAVACTAATARCSAPAAGRSRAEQRVPEEEEGGGGSEGLIWKNKKI
jgi:hypothetical protein